VPLHVSGVTRASFRRRYTGAVWCNYVRRMCADYVQVVVQLASRHASRHETKHAHPQYSIDCSSIEYLSEGTRNAS
jgi:hypothetical protein